MSPRVRTVLPTDLVALVSYDGKVYANEAMTRDRIGTQDSPHPLETAFEQWFSFATGRHTWISVKGATLRGLVSARKRGSKLAWEVDCLIHATDDDGVLMSLLDQLTEAAGKSGALRVFVRLPARSGVERAAARCGFQPYLREQTYRRFVDRGEFRALPDGLRHRTKADQYATFQLYNEVVPAEVRRMEAMTFAEWTAAQESLGRTSPYVIERDGKVTGTLRVAGDGDAGRFDLLGRLDALDDLIAAGMAKVANRSSAYVLVAEYQDAVARRLAATGFEAAEEYVVLSRKTAHPVKVRRMVPALVRPTLG